MDSLLEQALADTGAEDCINSASEKYLLSSISHDFLNIHEEENIERLPRLGYLFELEGLQQYIKSIVEVSSKSKSAVNERNAVNQIQILKEQIAPTFKRAFSCWRSLINLDGKSGKISDEALRLITEEPVCESIPAYHSLALHLAVCGILAQRTAEVRLELKKFEFKQDDDCDWYQLTIKYVIESFVLITRKDNGWEDIDQALHRISVLRSLQKQKEDEYIEKNEGDEKKLKEALKLVGVYHLAQMINLTGEYLQTGSPGLASSNIGLDRNHDKAIAALDASDEYLMKHAADLIWIGCRELLRNSIWTHAASLPTSVRKFIDLLSKRGRPNPIIELWPAQQEALYRNLLTTYHRAILVEMPTSAGKTLLAKFAIIQTKALVPEGTIVYIVPTRALANQVTFDLRSDFKGLEPSIKVEMTVPAYELDPIENSFLQNPPDILVTTPEKLDLLIRKEHLSVKNISMIIADEAHNIQESGRGPRLELLLGTLKRERPAARFLLLSPFMPNADEILSWLGEGMALPAIEVDWRPGNRIVGAIDVIGRRNNRQFVFETLPAADNSDIKGKWKLVLASGTNVPSKKTIPNLTIGTIRALRDQGSILILCKGKGTATKRAIEIAETLGNVPETQELLATCAYLGAESGEDTPLIGCLKKGVAYHHAGISHEARWLIEKLIKNETVEIICGTTTLAQGVNFPISIVVVETLKKGRNDLTYEDFWNIAGRAGRTLMDSVGVIGFPINDSKKRKDVKDFLIGEADEIASQLASLIDSADTIGNRFDAVAIARNPYLSELLQFLAHTMRVAGRTDLADEVEDIMRASLVYHQKRKEGGDAAEKLLLLCKRYLLDLSKRQNLKGLLAQADVAGFSTPSILLIRHKLSEKAYNGLKKVEFWEPDKLFELKSKNLTRSIELVGTIPEIRLGYGITPPFNPERVADIIKCWVNGHPLKEISEKYPMSDKDMDPEERLEEFSRYLFELIGKASWGVGALEGLSLSHASEEDKQKVGYTPSMIFFGVGSKEAVWLRMVGVPRILADGLAKKWLEKNPSPPDSYDEIRNWIDALSDLDWAEAIPDNTLLNPNQCRYIWNALKG